MKERGRTISPAARRRSGFTLLELLLAMSMVAILSLTLSASLSIAYRGKRSAENATRPIRAAMQAADLVGQDLQSVLPPTGILAGAFTGTEQDGAAAGASAGARADTVDFYCLGEDATPDQQTHPTDEGIRHVQLAVRTDVDPPVLVRRVSRNLLSTTQQDPDEEILCRGVRSLTIRYFDGTTWYDSWDSTTMDDSLPTAIELTLDVQKDPQSTVARDPAQREMPAPGRAAVATSDVPPDICRITRVIPLSCAKPTDTTSTGGTQ